jgi:transmembrane sensor
MRREFFELLMDKYLAGTADATERKLVEDYLDRMSVKYPEGLNGNQLELITKDIYSRLEEQIHTPDIIPMRRRWYRRVAAAAAILILIGSGIYYFNSGVKNNVPVVAVNDASPGKTSATLTLADGRKITLDSTADGLLAVEGGININSENGIINYGSRHSGAAQPNPGSLNTQLLYNTLTTRRGEQYRALKLADGTRVWLNASSSIHFPVAFNNNERKVEVSGEVYFEVANDKQKPFKVRLLSPAGKDESEILVLGTSFNINAYPEESSIKTTLIEGSVKISANNKQLILTPGTQAELNQNDLIFNRNIDIEEVTAWKDGLFQFESSDIKAVMRQLSRWYDIEVIIEPDVPERKFFGSISRNVSLSGVLKILKANDINYKIDGKKLIVTK